MMLACVVVGRTYLFGNSPPILALALSIAVGGLAYGAAAAVLCRRQIRETIFLIKQR